jgi:peptide/nickel transport system permease protein
VTAVEPRSLIGLRRRPVSPTSSGLKVGAVVLAAVTLALALAPLLAPYPTTVEAGPAFLPPGPGHLLGTDEGGRDVLSRVLVGMRTSWFSALVVVSAGMAVGTLVGMVAGLSRGAVDDVLMRLTDGFLALPGPLVAIAVVSALGPSLTNTLVAVSLVWWPYYARIVRGEIVSLRDRPFVEAARLAAPGRLRLVALHIFPGIVPTLAVVATLDIAALILTLAGLSFLGLGAPAPAPELGAMVAQGTRALLSSWWIPVVPGIAVMLLALVANTTGDRMGRS